MDTTTALLLVLVVIAIGNYFLSNAEERGARRRTLSGFFSMVLWCAIALLALIMIGQYFR